MAGDPAADRQALVQVINLGLVWHCLCAITRLEVPERLAAEPLPVAELAAAVGAHPDALWRVLRLLADHHIVTFEGDRVGLTGRGRLLCRGHPASLSAAFATVGDSDIAHGLTDTLRTGRAAAPRVLGMGYWDYLAAHPDQQALFDQAMVQRAQALSLACVPALDWPASGTIADLAGGTGTLVAAVLQAAPGARGILVDQPQVLERARPFLEHQGVADRCLLHPGDLFAPPPPADLYLLASVLHDWDDAHAARILAALGHRAASGTRLWIFEMLLPTDATPHRAKMSDVLMLLMFDGARERTLGQCRDLLEGTGWRLERVVASPGPMSVIQASRPAPGYRVRHSSHATAEVNRASWGGTVRYREANQVQRFLRWSAATAPMSWLYLRMLHHLDRLSYRLTRGRHSLSSWLSGLPVVMLTTTGARTGQQRTMPVIAVPDGDNLVVIASNWGQRQHPAWYHNLRAHPEATVTVGGIARQVRAHEAVGEERDRLWQQDLEVYPGRTTYARRAANRPIPVVVLAPVNGQPG